MVIKENDVIGILKKLADKMNGIFTETYGLASIYIDNTVGKGTIKAFAAYSGISSLVFDIRFSRGDFFERSNQFIQSICCLYLLERFLLL